MKVVNINEIRKKKTLKLFIQRVTILVTALATIRKSDAIIGPFRLEFRNT